MVSYIKHPVYNAYIQANQSERWCHSRMLDSKSLARAHSIRNFLSKWVASCGISSSTTTDTIMIRKCVVCGFFSKAAQAMPDGTYRSVRNKSSVLHIDPASVLSQRTPEWVVFHEVVQEEFCLMRECSVIEGKWLVEIANHYYVETEKTTTREEWDTSMGVKNRVLF